MTKAKLLVDKKILVTGASRGLGRAICEYLAQEGAHVAFNYASDEEGAKKTLNSIVEKGAKGLSFKASVLASKELQQMVKEIEQSWGGIDILINNAGMSQPLPIALMEEEDWDGVMDLNTKGTFLTTRAVLRGMIRRKQGCILNIGSLAGMRLLEAPIHYSTSKAAIKGFTQSLSKEVARYGIRVNCLAPGLLDEGVSSNLPQHREREYLKHVSLHRKGTLEEVAKFVGFLVSERNSYMNGCSIIMDGGF